MKNFIVLLFLSFSIFSVAQQLPVSPKASDLTTLKYTVEEAADWTSFLKRNSGWFGGDGIYTIPFNGYEQGPAGGKDKILFLFSDSMIGEIKDHTMQPGYKMIHNSVAVLKGNKPVDQKMAFYWDKDSAGKPESVFIPKTPKTEKDDYFWLGDGFVNQELNNNVYIFGYRVRNIANGPFGFKEVGNVLIKIPANSLPPYTGQKQMDTPFYLTDEQGDVGSFGAGIYVNTKGVGAPAPDGYVYIYGVNGKWKNLLVARVLPKQFEDFSKWTYWDGINWVGDIKAAVKVADWVSNELSLTALPDGRYALIFQIGGMTKDIGLRIGQTPYGPFGPVIKIWDCSKDMPEKTYLVYNAKAHPSLSRPGELVVSYNINSTEFIKDLGKDPNLYRPRFIRIKFN